jgi:hypothetical protein
MISVLKSLADRCSVAQQKETYALEGDVIVATRVHRGERRIRLSEVEAWCAHPEMTFDIVEIQLRDGRSIRWFDVYDDLLGILREHAREREVES